MTTFTMRRVGGDFVVTGPDIEPKKFKTRREARDWCPVHYPGSPIREIVPPQYRTNTGCKATACSARVPLRSRRHHAANLARTRVHERVAAVCRRTRDGRCYLRSRERERGTMKSRLV